MKKLTVLIMLVLILLSMFCFVGCSGDDTIYECGYCGHEMKGAYWDYINGRYACRSCSKYLRD